MCYELYFIAILVNTCFNHDWNKMSSKRADIATPFSLEAIIVGNLELKQTCHKFGQDKNFERGGGGGGS